MVNRTHPIRARERSSVQLTAEEFRFLEESHDFWALAESGILSLQQTGRARYALSAGSFVGQAIVNGRPVIVEEKIEGALLELLELTTHLEARVAEAPGVVSKSGKFIERLAERFLNGLGEYLARGRKKTYLTRRLNSSFLRGKIEITRTMRLWAKGRKDQVAYLADELSADILENRLIGVALYRLDQALAAIDTVPTVLLARARAMAIMFEDVGWPQMLTWPVTRIASLFDAKLRSGEISRFQDLLALARIFALHFGVSGEGAAQRIPISWFVNLETLFEDAVRNAFSQAASHADPSPKVTDWKADARFVVEGTQKYRAEPDVVCTVGSRRLIIDAKYKELGDKPDSGDIHQLVAHMLAYDVKLGALIYPSDAYERRYLGETPVNQRIFVFSIRLGKLREDASRVVSELTSAVAGVAVTLS